MKAIKLLLINSLTALVIAEILLRILGFTGLYKYSVVSDPPGCIAPSGQLGFQLNPGTFSITINDSLKYTATQVSNPVLTTRVTSTIPRPITSDSLIFLSGCSFTYGMGVDDSLTYPYRLQSELKNYNVINGAAPAYGTLQTLLIARRLGENGIRPYILVYNYLDYHRERNVLGRSFRQLLFEESRMEGGREAQVRQTARFPCGELESPGGRLAIKYAEADSRNLFGPLRSWSALVNQLEYAWNRLASEDEQADAVTEAAILDIRKLCEENGINFIVAVLKESEDGPSIQRFCTRNGIPVADLSIDYDDPGFLNLPYDGHPNGKAHAVYASKLYRYLTEGKWVSQATKSNQGS